MKFARLLFAALMALAYSTVAIAQSQGPTFNSLRLMGPSKPGSLIIEPDGDLVTTPVYNVMSYGFVGDGTTDNASALSTMLTAITSAGQGGRIRFPCGSFSFTTSLAYTIPSGKNVTIEGEGCTKLLFGATDGLVLTYTDNSSWAVVRNLELASSSAAGTNTAIWLKSAIVNVPQNARSSVVEHVHINGSDGLGQTNYWGQGVFQDKVSFVNINDLTFNGRDIPSLGGEGVVLQGDAANTEFNVVTNITNSNFAYCSTGVKYGTYYQGLTFVGSNITGCTRGIYQPAGNDLNLQATISNSQFNTGTAGIEFASKMTGAQIIGNLFLLHADGIKTVGLINSTISGNSFEAAVSAGTGDAIRLGSSADTAESASITSNTCLSINSCINVSSGARGKAGDNVWWNTTSPYQNSSSTFFQFGNIQNGAQFVSQAGSLSTVTLNDTVTANNLMGSKTSPTIGSGFCTSPSIVVPNGTWSFRVNVGSACATSSGVVAMPTAANGWSCQVTSGLNVGTSDPAQDLTGSTASQITIRNYSRTTGAAANFTSSDVLLLNCLAQ